MDPKKHYPKPKKLDIKDNTLYNSNHMKFQNGQNQAIVKKRKAELPGIMVRRRVRELVTYTGKEYELIWEGCRNVLKLDCGGSYMSVYNCQKLIEL